jgi:CTP synthase (UTP-ammonia lyase)
MSSADNCRIGIVGDFRGTPAQLATVGALEHAASALATRISIEWIATNSLRQSTAAIVRAYSGLFIAPGGPYENVAGALEAIRVARTEHIPLLGTCGGFQHVLLEFTRDVLGIRAAQHAEYDPGASELVIAPLACSLVGQRGEVFFERGSRAETIYGAGSNSEEYRCNYGLVRDYESRLIAAGLAVSGRDAMTEARLIELPSHPFFMATLFVPQLSSQPGAPHPLVSAFVAVSQP